MLPSLPTSRSLFRKPRFLNCRGRLMEMHRPLLMGILNISDDSFFDGGQYVTEEQQRAQCARMLSEGADIIDIGACSTRPGSKPVDARTEMLRLRSTLTWFRREYPEVPVSVDTWRADVARMAVLEGGADIINDISGGTMDQHMFGTVAGLRVPYVLSHIQGTPQDMQQNPVYRDPVGDILLFLSERVDQLRQQGAGDLMIDPGFGFGKNAAHNFAIARELHRFQVLELPVMAGVSRKSMIRKTLGITPDEALNGTTVMHTLLLLQGTDILRVHDVRPAAECLQLVSKYLDANAPDSEKFV